MPRDPKECREHAARDAELTVKARAPRSGAIFLELSKNWEKITIQLEDAFARRFRADDLPS
jgi:hypothetical protein